MQFKIDENLPDELAILFRSVGWDVQSPNNSSAVPSTHSLHASAPPKSEFS